MRPFPPAVTASACLRWPSVCGLLSGAVLLAGCFAGPSPAAPSPVERSAPPGPVADEECGAQGFAHLAGQHFSRIAELPIRGALRVLHPHQAMTMDFSATRLNVRVDRSGQIIEVFCG